MIGHTAYKQVCRERDEAERQRAALTQALAEIALSSVQPRQNESCEAYAARLTGVALRILHKQEVDTRKVPE